MISIRKITGFVLVTSFFLWQMPSLMVLAHDKQILDSKTLFNMRAGSDATPPVHPLRPEQTIQLSPNNQTQMPGPLSIDVVPSFDFEAQMISSFDRIYHARPLQYKQEKYLEQTLPNYIQVTDIRGTQTGWRLTVTQEIPFQTEKKQEGLHGSYLQLNHLQVASTIDQQYAPDVPTLVQLIPGKSSVIATAEKGHGMGTWVIRFGEQPSDASSGIQLSVPGRTVKKAEKYETILKWTLSDVPVN